MRKYSETQLDVVQLIVSTKVDETYAASCLPIAEEIQSKSLAYMKDIGFIEHTETHCSVKIPATGQIIPSLSTVSKSERPRRLVLPAPDQSSNVKLLISLNKDARLAKSALMTLIELVTVEALLSNEKELLKGAFGLNFKSPELPNLHDKKVQDAVSLLTGLGARLSIFARVYNA